MFARKVAMTGFTKQPLFFSEAALRACRMLLCVCMLAAASARLAPAQVFTSLETFSGPNGMLPTGLVQDRSGNVAGITGAGGREGDGTVFRRPPQGPLVTVHNFDFLHGSSPSTLMLGTDGNLYGTTFNGGRQAEGVVFRLSFVNVALTVLHDFTGKDGATPNALTEGADGNFYGTTAGEGVSTIGTFFKITPAGVLTTLGGFNQTYAGPEGGVVQGTDLNFYVATRNGIHGDGTLFRVTPTGAGTVIHSFDGDDGARPNGLVEGADGNSYGTAVAGGADNQGTIFKINTAGELTSLYDFDGGVHGSLPSASLIQGTDGNFYGTTCGGGIDGNGTIFRITPDGVLTTLHRFNGDDGACPLAALLQHTNGKFYGTTLLGGNSTKCFDGCGTLFSLDVGLGPFITFVRPFVEVGSGVQILGTGLTGATGVTFNGVAATTFSVVSDTFMGAIVPDGATTGPVQVTTPGGTLTSNVNLRIVR